MRAQILALIVWVSLSSSLAAQPFPSPEEILKRAPNADKFFRIEPDGSALHTPSGLSCPADLPNLNFLGLKVLASDGSDVSCQYVRENAHTGDTDAYVTLYFYRYAGVTTERNFADARRSIEVMYRGARHTGEIDLPEVLTTGWPDIRSAKYDLIMYERPFLSYLIVLEHKGWTVKTRVSTARDVLTPHGITRHVRDQMIPVALIKKVVGADVAPNP